MTPGSGAGHNIRLTFDHVKKFYLSYVSGPFCHWMTVKLMQTLSRMSTRAWMTCITCLLAKLFPHFFGDLLCKSDVLAAIVVTV